MGVSGGPYIVRDSSLVLELDAADRNSYVSGSLIWNSLTLNGNTGSLINGPTFSSASLGGIVFDGINDYCQFSSLPPGFQSGMTNYSISIWFKLNSYKEAPLLEMGSNSNDLERVMFWLTNESPNRLYALGAGQNGVYRYSSVYLSLNFIYNAVYTYNNIGTISTLYINSIQDNGLTNSTTNGLLTSLSNTWSLGVDNTLGKNFFQSANIYNVALYIKTLNQQEVLQNYNAQKSRFGLK